MDEIRDKLNASSWKESGNCEESKLAIAGEEILLLKPQLYMNCSGEAIAETVRFYKVSIENIIVFQDELDLVPGVIKIKQGGGAAGNKGIQDIIQELGSDFIRFRIGIGHPRDEALDMDVSDWVLTKPKAEHQELLASAISKCPEIAESLIKSGLKEAQRRFHTSS